MLEDKGKRNANLRDFFFTHFARLPTHTIPFLAFPPCLIPPMHHHDCLAFAEWVEI